VSEAGRPARRRRGATSLSWHDVWARRAARQFLSEPARSERLVEVVGAVGGIQAQVMPSAELAIGIRVDGISRSDVRAELWERRRLVKTYGPRGTIHLFPADELSLWLSALRAAPPPKSRSTALAATATSPDRLERLVGAIGETLADPRRGDPDGEAGLTRDELGAQVVRRTGRWASDEVVPAFGGMWQRWTQGIGEAALRGLLCFGPNRGNRVTFVRPERWLGAPLEPVDDRAAMAEVFLRYLGAFGPATPADFARWFYMDSSAATALAGSLRSELIEVDVEGLPALLPARDALAVPPDPASPGDPHLLPPFDAYVIGARPRDRLIPPDLLERIGEDRITATWARRALSGGTVSNLPVLLVDGAVAGFWERRRTGRRLAIRVEPFLPLSAARRERTAERVERIGRVLELDAGFELGAVQLRPHL
jgi:hypothetical protein